MKNFLRLENRHSGEIVKIRRVRDTNGQVTLIIETTLPPHKIGPPCHRHLKQREESVVKKGILGIYIGNKRFIVPAGGTVVIPLGIAHHWWNAGEDIVEWSGRAVPAVDLDRYLQAIFAIVNASESGKPSVFYLAHVLWRHRHTQTVVYPPRIIQWIIYPPILLIGYILGKYRGAHWPGSPESCTGAPEVTENNSKD